jgi:hypothetical protein
MMTGTPPTPSSSLTNSLLFFAAAESQQTLWIPLGLV